MLLYRLPSSFCAIFRAFVSFLRFASCLPRSGYASLLYLRGARTADSNQTHCCGLVMMSWHIKRCQLFELYWISYLNSVGFQSGWDWNWTPKIVRSLWSNWPKSPKRHTLITSPFSNTPLIQIHYVRKNGSYLQKIPRHVVSCDREQTFHSIDVFWHSVIEILWLSDWLGTRVVYTADRLMGERRWKIRVSI